MRVVTVAATQMACSCNSQENLERAERLIRKAAGDGANIILLQELFLTQYFPQTEDAGFFGLARPAEGHPAIEHMRALAKELGVVLPVGFFEKAGQVFFNSNVMIDADGTNLGIYRKTHIPDDPGYYEKFYFSPGDTGFRVWDTQFGRIGLGICWDQWFPETARALALQGAELIFYPTAIGTCAVPESKLADDPADHIHWQNVMLGHAAANMVPVIAANRIGTERCDAAGTAIRFWGASFISDSTGRKVKEAGHAEEQIITHSFDLDELRDFRIECCCFRDRRPECYGSLLTLDGNE
jgi:N-carbamoylputrescine amidase